MGLLNFMPGEWDMQGQGGLLGNRMSNPMLQLGLGILANNSGNGGSLGGALGRGGLTAIQNIQEQQRDQMRNKMYELEMKRAKRQMDEDDRKLKEQQAYSDAFKTAYQPAGVAPNMSFMDANNEVMAQPQDPTSLVNPQELPQQSSYQMQPTPAKFDQDAMLQNLLQNPNVSGSTKFAVLQSLQKDDTLKLGKGERLLKKNPDGSYASLVEGMSDEESLPDKVKQYEYAKKNGYTGRYEDFIKIPQEAMMPYYMGQLGVAQANSDNAAVKTFYETGDGRKKPQAPKGVTVSVGGKTYTFPDQKSANNFKMKAGIR
jgi:hypothetical protein